MIYVISKGEYSEYTISAILVNEAEANIDDLFKEFETRYGLTGLRSDDDAHEKNRALLAQEYEMEYKYTRADGSEVIAPPDTAELFTEWLVREHSFTSVDWNELNTGY